MARPESTPTGITADLRAGITPAEPAIQEVDLSHEGPGAEPTAPTFSLPKDTHTFAYLLQNPFPISAITNETPEPVTRERDGQTTTFPDIGIAVRFLRQLSRENRREWVTHISEARSKLDDIAGLVNAPAYSDIARIVATDDPRKRSALKARINKMILDQHGLTTVKESRRGDIIAGYGQRADLFIANLGREPKGVLAKKKGDIDQVQEVKGKNDVLDLLTILFSTKHNPKVRFHAARKLVLIDIIANIDIKYRLAMEANATYQAFNDFLNTHVWEGKEIGDTRPVTLLSYHAMDDYRVVGEPKEISEEEADNIEEDMNRIRKVGGISTRRRISKQNVRYTSLNGKKIEALISDREEKDDESRIIKMLREGEMDSGVANKDDMGALFVAKDVASARRFKRRISEAGRKAQVRISVEDISDTLDGKLQFNAEHPASSPELRVLKFRVYFKGRRIEIQIYDRKGDLDATYKDGPSHLEYEINRLFDKDEGEPFELLFPHIWHRMDPEETRHDLINDIREGKRVGNF